MLEINKKLNAGSGVRTPCLVEISPEKYLLFLFLHSSSLVNMSMLPPRFWKIILIVTIIITIVSLASLPYLYENISGNNIPNRPQGEPPIEYQWDTAISRILIALMSLGIGVYSYKQVRNNNR